MIQDFKNMEYTNITTKENVYYKIKQNIHNFHKISKKLLK